ncbi:FG-GAP-like repeat-containing protein [Sphingobium yanoikuyae]|uniref:FG-GAP-like repeat-containing protein n=1 Tax=Sphingobium yanoikuyae TaxID=13690 RepID=UPI002FDEC6A1
MAPVRRMMRSLALAWLCATLSPAHSQTIDGQAISGAFAVTSSGSAVYSIDLKTAAGTAGTAPQFSLSYNSQGSQGELGAGWSISGFSVISRGPRTQHTDGQTAGVNLNRDDALFLDGQRLIPVERSGAGSATRIIYRKEIDDLTRITQSGESLADATFLVETKGGVRVVFDGANNSRVKLAGGQTLLLAASEVQDTAGNFIQFLYAQGGDGDYYIESVRYAGHRGGGANLAPYAAIDFQYEAIARPVSAYIAGQLMRRKSRLKQVVSRVSANRDIATVTGTQIARYSFDYEDRDSLNGFVLTTVRQFDETGAVQTQPTKFVYSPLATNWVQDTHTLPISALAAKEDLSKGYRFGNILTTTPGRPDLLFSAQIDGRLEAFAYRNEAAGWGEVEAFRPPFAFITGDGKDAGALLLDVDGDGKEDLLQSNKKSDGTIERSAWRAGATKWEDSPTFKLPFNLTENGERNAIVLIGRWSGGKGPDLLYTSASTGSGFLTSDGAAWVPQLSHVPKVALTRDSMLVDVNCDGRAELVTPDPQSPAKWLIYRYEVTGWALITDPLLALPFDARVGAAAIRSVDLNGDKCLDLVVASKALNLRAAYLASATKWTPDETLAPKFDLDDAKGVASDAVVADFNGDGKAELVASKPIEGGTAFRFAYGFDATGWHDLGAAFTVRADLSDDRAYVGDLDGDGIADIAVPEGNRNGFGQVYRGSSTALAETPALSPRISLARRDQQDRGIRFVDLNGDGLTDVLFSREGEAVAGGPPTSGAFINTAAGWIPAPGLVPPQPLAGDTITGDPAQFADVDNDGFTDLLYAYRRANGSSTTLYYKNVADGIGGRKWAEQTGSKLVPPVAFAAEQVGDLGVRLVDLNGDGRIDMLQSAVTKVPAGQVVAVETCTPVAGPLPTTQCEFDRSLFPGTAYLNMAGGWQQTAAYTPPLPLVALPASTRERSEALGVELVDVNGDGLPDLVARFKHPLDAKKEVSEVWYNSAKGWARAPASAGVPVLLDETTRNRFAMSQWTDLNGDGLADLVYTERAGSTNKSMSWLSTGRGFVQATNWQAPLEALAEKTGDPSFRLVDLNGDGVPDILSTRKLGDGSVKRGAWFNSGTGWTAAPAAAIAALPAFIDNDGADQGLRLVDVNGDGLLDAVRAYAPQSGAVVQQTVLLNTGRRADVLRRIDQGNGVSVDVFYQTLLEATPERATGEKTAKYWSKVYQTPVQAPALPLISPVPTSYVVRRVITTEGPGRANAVSYRYGDYALDTLSSRLLGFGWRESYDESARILTRTEYGRTVLLSGRPLLEASCALTLDKISKNALGGSNLCPTAATPGIQRLSETTSDYKVSEASVTPIPGPTFKVWQVAIQGTVQSMWELDGKLVSREATAITYDEPANLFDRWLEVTKTVTMRSDGTSLTTVNEYAQDDPSRWYLARLTKSTVTHVGDAKSGGARKSETRISAFTYDPQTGLIATETLDAGAPKAVTKTFLRDGFGNVVETRIATAGIVRRNQNDFDGLGRFVTEARILVTKRPPYRITTVPRVQDGAPLSIIDEDNQITRRFQYDGFGRPILATDNNGLQTLTRYLRVASLPDPSVATGTSAVNAVTMKVGALPEVVKLLDGRGRVVRTVIEGFTQNAATARPLFADIRYDSLGRIEATAIAYDKGAAPRWERADYDVLNRVTKQTRRDGQIILMGYAGRTGGGRVLKVTEQGPTPRTSTTEVNTRNLPVRVSDARGAGTVYSYDAADRVESVTGPNGATTRFGYQFGQRTDLFDPDLGHISYEYNGLGELVGLTDAKNTKFTLTRDELGRVVKKVGGGITVNWEFDETQYGVGRLNRMWDTNKFEKSYTYDANGDVQTESVKIDTETFVTTFERDQYRRVTRTVYPVNPTGQVLAARSRYDDKGYLHRISDDVGAATYWQALQIDASSRILDASLGDGVRRQEVYDNATDRLLTLKAMAVDGAAISNLALTYDEFGNIKRRQDSAQKIDEIFGYDELNRLTSAKDAGSNLAFRYDNAGRLRQLGASAGFAYWRDKAQGGWQPEHAVTATTTGGKTTTYHYDANGNRDSGPAGTTYGYTDDNRLKFVKLANGDSTAFEYAPDGTRYRQIQTVAGRVTETIYVGAFERITQYAAAVPSKREMTYRYFLGGPDGVFGVLQVRTAQSGGSVSIKEPSRLWLVLKDQLGSVIAVTDAKGVVAARFWYDAWGKRVRADLTALGSQLGAPWTMGFGGHEHLLAFGLIHMNGRVYDPATGMFLSADPLGADGGGTQTIGRYLYANNNPLRFIDPSGYWSLGGAIKGAIGGFIAGGPGGAIVGAFLGGNDDTRRWIEQNWREVAIATVAIAATVATGGMASPILAGMIVGAVSGATSAILYGGSFDEVLFATVKGAVIGGISAGAFNAVGNAFVGAEHSVGAVAAHGVVGGGLNAMQGGDFWKGFVATAATKATSAIELRSASANMARAAIVGGTMAEINGEKFSNGAILGLYSYTFNDLAHKVRWMTVGAAMGGAVMATASVPLDAATGGANILATPQEIAFGAAAGAAAAGYLYDIVYSEGPVLPDFDFWDPSKAPVGADGKTWTWEGRKGSVPGDRFGGYKNPSNPGQSIHPDLGHGPPYGPHWDFNDRKSKEGKWRVDENKKATPK